MELPRPGPGRESGRSAGDPRAPSWTVSHEGGGGLTPVAGQSLEEAVLQDVPADRKTGSKSSGRSRPLGGAVDGVDGRWRRREEKVLLLPRCERMDESESG